MAKIGYSPQSMAERIDRNTKLLESLDVGKDFVKTTGDTMTGALVVNKSDSAINVKGTGVGNSNTGFITFSDNNGRVSGTIGDTHNADSSLYINSSINDIRIQATNGIVYVKHPRATHAQESDVSSLTRKDYVDSKVFDGVGGKVSKTGDTMTGILKFTMADDIIQDSSNRRILHNGVDIILGNEHKSMKLNAGTGRITISSNDISVNKPLLSTISQPTTANALTRKDYVDSEILKATNPIKAGYVKKAGDTMTGALVVNNDITINGEFRLKGTGGSNMINNRGGDVIVGNDEEQMKLYSKDKILVYEPSRNGHVYTTLDKPTPAEIGSYTISEANGRFLGKTEKANDSNKLDGLDSTDFTRKIATPTSSASNDSLANQAWVTNFGSTSNVDHVWHDEASNTWNFVSNGSFKSTGNATVRAATFNEGGTTLVNKYLGKTAKAASAVQADKVVINASTSSTFYPVVWHNNSNQLFDTEGRFDFQASTGHLKCSGDITAFSDVRLKTNITQISGALNKVSSIRGVTYDRTDINTHQMGVIAQEVEKVCPEVVHTGEDGMKSVAYGNMVGLLIEAIKELKEEVECLK